MSEFVQVEKNEGEGYWRAVEYGAWTAAFLNYSDRFEIANLCEIERHCGTDEVFGLIDETAYLIIAGDKDAPSEDVEIIKMEKGVMYNVKKCVWHQIVVSKNASTFIVENSENHQTERKPLDSKAIDFAKSIIKF